MLSPYQNSQFDLNFTLLGVPIKIQPMFWLVTILLGWNNFIQTNDLSILGLWVMAVFISIIIHEFGHVFMGKLFGTESFVILHGFGGLAVGATEIPSKWKRILITAAGPAAQLFFWLLLRFTVPNFGPLEPIKEIHEKLNYWLDMLIQINLYWPLLNLIPVFPLDGGQILKDALGMIRPGSERLSYQLSTLAAIGAIIYFAKTQQFYLVFLFVLLAMQSYEMQKGN
jgi:stage IV sporulation protein FB